VGYKTPPTLNYTNPQIVLNTGRILLNSKQDSILLSSAKVIGLSAQESINLQSTNDVILYGKKVLLGGPQATQPVLKGEDTVEQLKQVLTTLNELLKIFENLAVPLPTQLSSIAGKQSIRLQTVNAASKEVRTKLTAVLGTLDGLKSKTVYTL
jgi:hypothetical protein